MNEALRQLESLLQNSAAGPKSFPPNSRYNAVPVLAHALADGQVLPYLSRRFIPPENLFSATGAHTGSEGDRRDNIAARSLGDPELYWRLCDANGALRPDELVEAIGRSLRIALPEGIG